MRLHGAEGDVELGGDLGVRQAAGHEPGHLGLAGGELVESGVAGTVGAPPAPTLEEADGELRTDEGVPLRRGADGGQEQGRAGVLEEEAGGPEVERPID